MQPWKETNSSGVEATRALANDQCPTQSDWLFLRPSLALCVKLRYPIYAPNSVPEQIAQDKRPYYAALEAADNAWSGGRLDVSAIEQLLDTLLARQLYGVLKDARGRPGKE